jgi:hypothetical protein
MCQGVREPQAGGPAGRASNSHPGLAEPSARLCENPEIWPFGRRNPLVLLRHIFEKLSFHTVWRLVGQRFSLPENGPELLGQRRMVLIKETNTVPVRARGMRKAGQPSPRANPPFCCKDCQNLLDRLAERKDHRLWHRLEFESKDVACEAHQERRLGWPRVSSCVIASSDTHWVSNSGRSVK